MPVDRLSTTVTVSPLATSASTRFEPMKPAPPVTRHCIRRGSLARIFSYGSSAVPSIFTRIIDREIPAHILREDSEFLAFLDVRPIREGHTLVIPKAEIPDVFDLPEALLGGLLPFARPVAKAIQQVTGATRIGMAVVGLEVPHAHVHLVPIDGLHDLDFRRARPADDDDLAAAAERIRAALDG